MISTRIEAVAVRHLEYGIPDGPFCVNNHGMYDEIESAEKWFRSASDNVY